MGGPVTDDDERWAVPAYIGIFVGGFVAPAIVYAARARTSPFVRFHAAQALNLFIAMAACNLVAVGILVATARFSVLPIIMLLLAAEAFCVIRAAIGANRCEWYRLPPVIAWPIIR
jgi:uncharacterized membrane protein